MGEDERDLIVAEFNDSAYPNGIPTLETAWLGIYQVLWWYEHGLLHVCEANELKKGKGWSEKAKDAEAFIADHLHVPADQLSGMVDRMIRLPRWTNADGTPMQRNNPVGHGFRYLVGEVLERWGSQRFTYPQEQNATLLFPGIVMHGRSKKPAIDVTAIRKQANRVKAVISCKWSIRHDRISDPTNECTAYKSAAVQQQLMDLQYFVVTNEMNANRLDKVIEQPCVDGLIHVNLDLVRHLNDGDTPMMTAAIASRRLFDLVTFTQLTHTWG